MSYRDLLHKFLDGAYHIGIIEDWDIDKSLNDYKRVNWIDMAGYDHGWFADPFILESNEKYITLLVEEFEYNKRKGRICKIIVDRNDYKLKDVSAVLELTSHLSYPYPIDFNGETYIIPENCAANEISIYRFDGKKLYNKVKILEGKYVDTQFIKLDDKYFLFTTKTETYGGSSTLEVFVSNDFFGSYHHYQTIKNANIEERGAGPIFELQGRLIRPTQDCNNGYGKGVVLSELNFNGEQFTQRELTRINSNSKEKYGLCLHTFSPYGNMLAIDGFDYPNRWVGSMAPKMYAIKAKLLKTLGR